MIKVKVRYLRSEAVQLSVDSDGWNPHPTNDLRHIKLSVVCRDRVGKLKKKISSGL